MQIWEITAIWNNQSWEGQAIMAGTGMFLVCRDAHLREGEEDFILAALG